ncbi:prevent-host-death protein [Bacteroides clarus]|uniref:Prevent-host-death protein n=1 Tax=Bacteroides clarus TaxID=626929 RepID=A0A412Y922_9BACE|nr:prevent-host-death protein [Bacteroides clarus]RGV37023.1 prevent-host-death protein [Bacteroides clarus]RGV53866.1 prevent-host-death protein [Bacteroides clarus]
MLVISSREFRENQKKYFDSVDGGEQVIVQRGKDRSYKLVPVTSEDACMTQEEFYAKVNRSLQQVREGKAHTLDLDKLDEFLGL